MDCPFCGAENSEVKDTRPVSSENAIRRRRVCPGCKARFTTFERVSLRDIVVIKRSGRTQPFDREKLARAVLVAVAKRGLDRDVVEQTIATIVRQLESTGERVVSSCLIGDLALRALKNLDDVAYVRFASVYQDFAHAEDFASFLTQQQLT